MSDERDTDPGLMARATDGFTDAKRAVDEVTKDVKGVTAKFAEAVHHPTEGVRGLIVDLTRRAPFAMLGAAFVLGILFGGRRD